MPTDPDPQTTRPRRVLVAGLSGSGKTTLAARLAEVLDIPHVELDSLHHGPGWVPRPTFLDDVRELASREAWVTEWQYAAARPLLTERADTLVWLNLPFRVSLTRVVRRTLRRRIRGEVLWNGNVEPPLYTFFTDREHVVRYSVATRHKYATLVPTALATHPRLTGVHLHSGAEVAVWVASLG
ncbi:MAG: AAA family ATPase [Nocardioides sp.]